MKLLHILDESSFKNISIVRVAEIVSRYKFKNYQSEIITRKKKKELKNYKIKYLLFSNYFYFLKLFILLKKNKQILSMYLVFGVFLSYLLQFTANV